MVQKDTPKAKKIREIRAKWAQFYFEEVLQDAEVEEDWVLDILEALAKEIKMEQTYFSLSSVLDT